MKCAYCGHGETKVIDTRETEDSDVTRRRRECLKCQKRFTTYERIEMLDLRVIKKDGSIVGFDRDKVMKGIIKAAEKRPIKIAKIERIVDDVQSELRQEESTEIPSKLIGEKVMERLKKLDKITYIRYASVYRDFTDLRSFEKELKSLKQK